MNPPLLCCVLSHWDTFQDLRMVEKCLPRDVHGIFAISWVINPDQQHLSSLWLRKMSLVISKNVKKPLPWKCLGCLSSWLKFSPFNGLTHTHTCALWLKECKHPSSPWAEKELGLYSGGFFHFYLFFFSLSHWENTEIFMWGVCVGVCCYSKPCDPMRGHVVSTAEMEKCTSFFWFMSNESRVVLFDSS